MNTRSTTGNGPPPPIPGSSTRTRTSSPCSTCGSTWPTRERSSVRQRVPPDVQAGVPALPTDQGVAGPARPALADRSRAGDGPRSWSSRQSITSGEKAAAGERSKRRPGKGLLGVRCRRAPGRRGGRRESRDNGRRPGWPAMRPNRARARCRVGRCRAGAHRAAGRPALPCRPEARTRAGVPGNQGDHVRHLAGIRAGQAPPRFVMAAELVETSRLWGRLVARIDPAWAETGGRAPGAPQPLRTPVGGQAWVGGGHRAGHPAGRHPGGRADRAVRPDRSGTGP